MKTSLLLVVPFSLSLTAGVLAADVPPPMVSVSGTAVTEVTPDVINWLLEVKNVGPELGTVAERHTGKVSAVLEILDKQGIAKKDVQTAQMQFGRNRVYKHNDWIEEGYFASTQVSFKLSDLQRYKALWIALAEQSGVSVTSVSFDHSKRMELRKETRRKALLAAKEKAMAMADALGASIGEPLSISEDFTPRYGLSANNNISNGTTSMAVSDDDSRGVLAPGTIPISERVLVSFRLQPMAK